MPTYKAPVSDTVFLLNDVFDYARYANAPGFAEAPIDVVEARPDRGREVRRGGRAAAEPHRRRRGLHAPRGRQRHHAQGLQGGLQGVRRGRLGRPRRATRNTAARACRIFSPSCSANTRPRPTSPSPCIPGLTNGAVAALMVHGSDDAEGSLSAEDDHRRVDRHDEPDRAAVRHGSRADQDQGGPAARRLLRHHRPEDFHLGRRA